MAAETLISARRPKACWVKPGRTRASMALNPSEGGGVMLERAAMDNGVVIVAALRSDRSVAELSTDRAHGAGQDHRGRQVHPAPWTRTA